MATCPRIRRWALRYTRTRSRTIPGRWPACSPVFRIAGRRIWSRCPATRRTFRWIWSPGSPMVWRAWTPPWRPRTRWRTAGRGHNRSFASCAPRCATACLPLSRAASARRDCLPLNITAPKSYSMTPQRLPTPIRSRNSRSCKTPRRSNLPEYSPGSILACHRSLQNLPAAEARLDGSGPAQGHTHCTVFELRNLAEGIQCRVGKLVDRRFVVAKGHEHGPMWRTLIGTRVQAHRAAARLDGDQIAGLRTEPRHIERIERCHRIRLNGIQHPRAARHAAGMPMLELAAGDQHHRILVVGPLIGRNDVGGHESRFAGGCRKRVDEHHGVPGIPFLFAGVCDAVFRLQTFPGDAADAGHGVPHLVEHLRNRLLSRTVGPLEAELAREIDDDLQILTRLARRIERLTPELHEAIRVGERAGLLRERRGRQNDIGEIGGLGEKNILHHQH